MRILLKDCLLCFLIVLPFFLLFAPMINLGADNLNMVIHFDRDEGGLIHYAGKTYSGGIIALEDVNTYPQLFYYIAGMILYPYTLLKGIDYHAITVILRGLNLATVVISLVFLYFFVLRFFKSRVVAALSCLLFVTNMQVLWLSVNSRPHLLSVLFTMASFYYCFKIAAGYKRSFFISAVIFSGLATATNLFGVFLIPSICLALFYSFTKQKNAQLLSGLSLRSHLIYVLSLLLIFISTSIPFFCIFVYLKRARWFKLIGIHTLREFLDFRNFRILCLVCAFFVLAGVCWFMMNRQKSVNTKRLFLLINKTALYFAAVVMGMAVVFFLASPTFLLFPLRDFKVILAQLSMTTMGSKLNIVARPIFDAAGLQWVWMLFDNNFYNIWFGALFAAYLFYETASFKKNWKEGRDSLVMRMLMLVFALFLILSLFLLVSHRPYHYLLPLVPVLGILIAYGAFMVVKSARSVLLRNIAAAVMSLLFILGLNLSCRQIYDFAKLKKQCNSSEFAVTIGKWLREKYPQTASIWIDSREFYLPPEYKNVFSAPYGSDITKHFAEIRKLSPEIIIITNQFDQELKNARLIGQETKKGIFQDYKLIRAFSYSGPLELGSSARGEYKEIDIFAR